jgi:hypothetical protein
MSIREKGENPYKFNEDPEHNLKLIELFFYYDMEIKRILYNCAPISMYDYDIGARITYSKRLEQALETFERYFYNISSIVNLDGEVWKKDTKKKFDKMRRQLLFCGTNFSKLSQFYLENYANMSNEIINMTGQEIIGYYCHRDDRTILEASNSINEMLHIFHSIVVNSNEFYLKMPKLSEKTLSSSGEPLRLFGRETPVARQMYDNWPIDLDSGYTDILSLKDDKIIMMVRDRGHALTIEANKEGKDWYVNYFIPKLCNIDMINDLPGVRKVNDLSSYTIGQLSYKSDAALIDGVISLVSQVPTDADIKPRETFHR